MNTEAKKSSAIRLAQYEYFVLVRSSFVQNNLKVQVGMQINIADKEHAKYVENHVPKYIWKVYSFCGYYCCMQRLLSIVRLYRQFFSKLIASVFLQAFVTQHELDRDDLNKALRSFEVPVINAREQTQRNPPPLTPQVPLPRNRSRPLCTSMHH